MIYFHSVLAIAAGLLVSQRVHAGTIKRLGARQCESPDPGMVFYPNPASASPPICGAFSVIGASDEVGVDCASIQDPNTRSLNFTSYMTATHGCWGSRYTAASILSESGQGLRASQLSGEEDPDTPHRIWDPSYTIIP